MGDNGACQMNGMGTVRIKMFDGAVKDLTEVRYVPRMKKNIISVEAVESKGLKVTLDNSVLKVTKGSMIVIVTPRSQNTYLVAYSDFSIVFFDLLPIFVLYYKLFL